jgi:hypothetical protein
MRRKVGFQLGNKHVLNLVVHPAVTVFPFVIMKGILLVLFVRELNVIGTRIT